MISEISESKDGGVFYHENQYHSRFKESYLIASFAISGRVCASSQKIISASLI